MLGKLKPPNAKALDYKGTVSCGLLEKCPQCETVAAWLCRSSQLSLVMWCMAS